MAPTKDKEVDPGWAHGEKVDSRHKVRCNYCKKVLSGGIHRFKFHLGQVSGDAKGCKDVPTEVRQQMRAYLHGKKVEKRKREKEHERISRTGPADEDNSDVTDDDDDNEEIRELKRTVRASREAYLQQQARLDELRRGAGTSCRRKEKALRTEGKGRSGTIDPSLLGTQSAEQTNIQPPESIIEKPDLELEVPGFRFNPTEEELLDFYLKGAVNGKKVSSDIIGIGTLLYDHELWELPENEKLPTQIVELRTNIFPLRTEGKGRSGTIDPSLLGTQSAKQTNIRPPESIVEISDLELPPGFRFNPTEEELVNWYLKDAVNGKRVSPFIIGTLNLYGHEPWELPELAMMGEKEWYFFVPRDGNNSKGGLLLRKTGRGFWKKVTGSERLIRSPKQVIGLKKTFVYHRGRAPRGCRTNWVMNEYRMPPDTCPIPKEDIALCKIYWEETSLKVPERRVAMKEDTRMLQTLDSLVNSASTSQMTMPLTDDIPKENKMGMESGSEISTARQEDFVEERLDDWSQLLTFW